MNTYTTSVVNTIDENLKKQWRELWKRSVNATAFNSYEWYLTCTESEKMTGLEVYVCYKNKTLAAILPLQSYRYFGIPVSGVLYKEHHVDTPFLIESYDKELFRNFFNFIFAEKNIFLQKVDQKAAGILHTLFPELFFSLMSVNPVVDLTKDIKESLSHSTIRQLKKIIRNNPDSFTFKVYQNDLDEKIQEMFGLEQRSSKKVRSMDIFSKKENRDFYLNIAANCKDTVRICFLYFKHIPIAYQYGYLTNNTFAGDQIAYHAEFAGYRPGKLIMYYLLEYLKKNNINTFDMGGGISSYKTEFTHDYRLLYNILYSKSTRTLLFWKLVNKARRIKQKLHPVKNTRDHEFLFKTGLL